MVLTFPGAESGVRNLKLKTQIRFSSIAGVDFRIFSLVSLEER